MRLTNVFYATLHTTAGILSSNKETDQQHQAHIGIAPAQGHLPTSQALLFDTNNRGNSKFSQALAPLNFQPPHLENLDHTHTAYRRSVTTAPQNTNAIDEDLTDTEIFRLFNSSTLKMAKKNSAENTTSVNQIVRNYLETKETKQSHPFIKHLLNYDYLRQHLKLDLTYRIKNYSPGEPPPSDAVDCETTQPMTHSPKQLETSRTMAQAVRLATRDISMHTPFSLREAQPQEAADIRSQTRLCADTPSSWLGLTSYTSIAFYSALSKSQLNVIDKTFTEKDAENVVAAFRQKYGGKSNINFDVGNNFSSIVSPGSNAYFLAMHELGHSLALRDTSVRHGLVGPEYEQYFLPLNQSIFENSAMAYKTIPDLSDACKNATRPLPQTFMPYDYLAFNTLAKLILKEQHADNSEEALQAIIARKSPHRGNTHYRFNPGINRIHIVDHRDGGVRATYAILPSPKGHVQLTLVDPGGYDTLDFRAFHSPVHIDMRPGGLLRYNTSALALSTAQCDDTSNGSKYDLSYKAKGNVYLTLEKHPNTLLEDVITGSGNDQVHGNDLDNVFDLGKGHDVVSGDKGCDSFIFQRGDNQLTIKDFNAACDRLVLHPNLGISNHRQLMAHTYKGKHDNSLTMHFRHGDRITLNHLGDKTKVKPENVLIRAYAENKIRRSLV